MPKKKITKKEVKKTSGLKTDIYNLKGEVVGSTVLPEEIFAAEANPTLLSQAVRVYQANQRLGTHDTKTRSEVAGSTRKIYRQKGTGRARHGAITAPIFIGGGIAHGPHPKDYSLSLPQKMKKQALFSVLSQKLKEGEVKIIRGLDKIETKTKKMFDTIANLKLNPDKDNTLLLTPKNLANVLLSGRNIRHLSIEDVKLINAYKLLSCKNLLMMEESVTVLADHFLPKNKKEKEVKVAQKTPVRRSK